MNIKKENVMEKSCSSSGKQEPEKRYRPGKAYENILGLSHHVSSSRPHMSLLDRAAQFSPFSALTGYEEAVREEGRITRERMELDEDAKRLLDEKMQSVLARKGNSSETVFTCFQADEWKEGGAYIIVRGYVKKLDPCERMVILTDGTHIPVAEIVDIQNDCIN